MYAFKDAYKAHTECIQAYKRVKERILLLTSSYFFLLLLYIVCSYIFYCPRFRAIIFYCPHLRAFTDPIALIARSFRPAGRMRVPRDAYRHLQTV